MKKTKKALASLAIAGMALTMVPFNAFATGTVPTRLAGTTAAQTAVKIADQTGWTGTAILASSASYGMVDALTSGPLATFLKAPILLQEPGAVLNADTKAELIKLNITKVYVTSGTAVINQAVLDTLAGMGITVESLGGVDRFDTSVNIAKKMIALGAPVSKVAVAYGWLNQDALSIAAIASASSSPILLTEKNAVPASVKAFLTANAAVTSTDVIGGTGVIADAVKAALPNATRHFGQTAYDTNNQVIQDFASALTFDNVYVANGVTGIDALSGAPLAAQTKSPIVLTDGKTVPAVAVFTHSKASATTVTTALGGEAVVPETLLAAIAAGKVAPIGTLSVTSVSAVSASGIKVVFNQAPSDTSKVTFTVLNLTTPVTTTATWNTAKTEATVSSSSNYPEGTYTVNVKDGNTDLGTKTVSMTQQKIASINITSTKLGVVTDPKDSSKQTGYATYNVLDQYGADITTGALANSLTFQSGVGTVTAKDGLLTLDSNVTNLMQFATVVITGYDSTTGVSVSATLTTSTQIGTLTNFVLGTLTNADGKVLTDGDSSIFYASYTATDISGNPTTNYDMIKGGLILHDDSNGNTNLLTTSNSYVTATLEEDPSDSTKAVVKVVANNTSGTPLTMDMPTVITAMTWTGKTSSINTTLKKAASINTFTVMSPSESIAVYEGKAIPFTALDQNGVALTKYSDLKTTNLTISNAKLFENADGTASLLAGPNGEGFTTDGQQVITATTNTGKYSSVTINIQKFAKADTLVLDTSVLLTNMQHGSDQSVDFGLNYGGFTVKDQYGRVFDMQGKSTGGQNVVAFPDYQYAVQATTTTDAAIQLGGRDNAKVASAGSINALAYGGNGIKISAVAGDTTKGLSGTVTFKLVNLLQKWATSGAAVGTDSNAVGYVPVHVAGTAIVADPAHPTLVELYNLNSIDTKSTTLSVLKDDDIKGYTMDTVTNPIFADSDSTNTTGGAVNMRVDDFAANPSVYGTTASGSKVVLVKNSVIGANVDSADFGVEDVSAGNKISLAHPTTYDGVSVFAKTLLNNVTTSSTNLSVTIMGADKKVHSVTTPIKSSTATPVASKLVASVATYLPGVTLNDAGDIAHVGVSDIAAGMIMTRYDAAGTKGTGRAAVYFYGKDQYGTKADPLSQIVVLSIKDAAGNVLTGRDFAVSTDGTISGTAHTGDHITLSAVTNSGLVRTIELIVN